MVFRTAREFIRERQALGRKKIESGYIFFRRFSRQEKKKFSQPKKNERIIFFFEKKRGKNRPSERQKMLMLLLLDVGCWGRCCCCRCCCCCSWRRRRWRLVEWTSRPAATRGWHGAWQTSYCKATKKETRLCHNSDNRLVKRSPSNICCCAVDPTEIRHTRLALALFSAQSEAG